MKQQHLLIDLMSVKIRPIMGLKFEILSNICGSES